MVTDDGEIVAGQAGCWRRSTWGSTEVPVIRLVASDAGAGPRLPDRRQPAFRAGGLG